MRLHIFQQHWASVKNNTTSNKRAQTLVVLLIFIMVAITIAMTSVSILISNAESTRSAGQTMEAYYAAEAGIENASLQLLRNPNYTGEILQVSADTTVEIIVTHSSDYVVMATGTSGGFTRVIEAKLDYTDNILSIISWTELYP